MAENAEGEGTGCDGGEGKSAGSMVAGLDTIGVNGQGVEGCGNNEQGKKVDRTDNGRQ